MDLVDEAVASEMRGARTRHKVPVLSTTEVHPLVSVFAHASDSAFALASDSDDPDSRCSDAVLLPVSPSSHATDKLFSLQLQLRALLRSVLIMSRLHPVRSCGTLASWIPTS